MRDRTVCEKHGREQIALPIGGAYPFIKSIGVRL